MKKVITILAATVLLFGCNKQKNKEPEKPVNKKEYVLFNLKFSYNSNYDNNPILSYVNMENYKVVQFIFNKEFKQIDVSDTIKRSYQHPSGELKTYSYFQVLYFDQNLIYDLHFNRNIDSVVNSEFISGKIKTYYFTW